MSQMMQPLFPGHVPLTDIELFQCFNIEMPDGSDMWEVHKRWGKDTYVDNFATDVKIKDDSRASRIALYAQRVANNLPIFVEND